MCGIAGFIDSKLVHRDSEQILSRMLASIVHRGPDDVGIWRNGAVNLGHRRLSIIELSPLGHQPMVSRSGRFVLVFNGEIYNHRNLRQELQAREHQFKGNSDTEVLLELIEERGLIEALTRSVGMFSLALWDRREQTLQLARDRFGEKPLYYGWHQNTLLFGSELKALIAHPAFIREVDRDALLELMRYGYVPAPYSIFANTCKIRPGTIRTFHVPGDRAGATTQANCSGVEAEYWTHQEIMVAGASRPFAGSLSDAVDQLESLLSAAVRLQLEADVPVGAFLSGGIDSSTVVALSQQVSSRPIRTYSIGFAEDAVNEAEHAKAVARHLETQHTEFYVGSADVLAVIPKLPTMYDEPFGDSSAIPTHLVAGLARREVTVALTGDGGDEMFYGYPKYAAGARFAAMGGRPVMGRLIGALPWTCIERVGSHFPATIRTKLTAGRFQTLQRLLSSTRPQTAAQIVSQQYNNAADIAIGGRVRASAFAVSRPASLERSYERMAMLLDRETYLPDDILAKVDRATMAVSLESRAPILDHRIAEFAATLPIEFLAGAGRTKTVLRELLYRKVPRHLVDRPKAGFSIPVARWLREDLNAWGQDLLHSRKAEDLVNLDRCRQLFESHARCEKDYSAIIWTILSFLAWTEQWL